MSVGIFNKTIELRRKYKIKLPDAIIAATAIADDIIINVETPILLLE